MGLEPREGITVLLVVLGCVLCCVPTSPSCTWVALGANVGLTRAACSWCTWLCRVECSVWGSSPWGHCAGGAPWLLRGQGCAVADGQRCVPVPHAVVWLYVRRWVLAVHGQDAHTGALCHVVNRGAFGVRCTPAVWGSLPLPWSCPPTWLLPPPSVGSGCPARAEGSASLLSPTLCCCRVLV